LLLNEMNAYTSWNLDPKLYIIYTDELGEIRIPDIARGTHPRTMLHRLADVFELPEAEKILPPQSRPRSVLGVAFMFEAWALATDDAELDEWRKKSFADHPRAYESRTLIAEQPGHPPVVASHHRDSKHTGQHIGYLVPAIRKGVMIPGTAMPSMLHNIHRIMVAMMRPAATFRAAR
jgi:hypothetical protein